LRLVAGADLAAADPLALTPLAGLAAGTGTITVGDSSTDKLVRTGTGDLDIRAGRDLKLAHYESVVYTAGCKDTTVFADFTTANPAATYGILGGDLRIAAQGGISSALPVNRDNMQLYTEWLNRQGTVDASQVFTTQSSWWVNYGQFKQGVGALGGGNVSVSAGGDLDNLLVALPTNGRVRGGRTAAEAKTLELRNGGSMTVDAGGAVRAGFYYVGRGEGTIDAGEFAIGRQVTTTNSAIVTTYQIAPVLSLGDATLSVKTAGDLRLQTVLDPLMIGQPTNNPAPPTAFMSGQTERTALDLTSIGGDVILVSQGAFLSKNLTVQNNVYTPYVQSTNYSADIYPSKLHVSSLNGSVSNLGTIYTIPSSDPEVRILAERNVTLGTIFMSRATFEMFPSPFVPVGGNGEYIFTMRFNQLFFNSIAKLGNANAYDLYIASFRNPLHLPNEDDYEPSRFYARSGSIIGPVATTTSRIPTMRANEQTWLRAGKDIRNVTLDLRNLHRTDTTWLEAGNDIINADLSVEGPGSVLLTAGRDVYNPRTVSIGNRRFDDKNRPIVGTDILGLPADGASIDVIAGLNGKLPSYDAFLKAYIDPANLGSMPDYLGLTPAEAALPDPTALKPGVKMNSLIGDSAVPLYLTNEYRLVKGGYDEVKLIAFVASATGRILPADEALKAYRLLPAQKQLEFLNASGTWKMTRTGLVSFIASITGEDLSPLTAWARFQTLPAFTQQRFIRQVYMEELREAGRDQNSGPLTGGYNRGYAAIGTLFPGSGWKGSVISPSVYFRTMSGGDITALAPGGGFQLAALQTPVKDGDGVVTLDYGNINLFARDSVTVNRSRILTFAGGDETIWSTLGDIDAGRGAKTTRVTAAPDVITDVDAVTRVLERADMTGSGIGTVQAYTGVEPGDVELIAPVGTVNFGDAGVRVSGNLNVAARFVLNIENLVAKGEVKGVPKDPPTVGPLTTPTNDKSATDAAKDATQQQTSGRPSVIIVEVLGYGSGDGEAPKEDDQTPKREPEQRSQAPSYDPSSPVRFVGIGTLSPEQAQKLTPSERRALEAQ
jgi:filamentous hemagglutinin